MVGSGPLGRARRQIARLSPPHAAPGIAAPPIRGIPFDRLAFADLAVKRSTARSGPVAPVSDLYACNMGGSQKHLRHHIAASRSPGPACLTRRQVVQRLDLPGIRKRRRVGSAQQLWGHRVKRKPAACGDTGRGARCGLSPIGRCISCVRASLPLDRRSDSARRSAGHRRNTIGQDIRVLCLPSDHALP
jgi:hypothetical protein